MQGMSEAPGKSPRKAPGKAVEAAAESVVSEEAPVPVLASGPTIKDVALALGMHKSTVSLALSGKGNVSAATRAKVLVVAREMGYEPHPLAQRLAHGASNSMVCLCSGSLDVGLTTAKILLIQKELSKLALEVPLYTFAEPLASSLAASGVPTSHAIFDAAPDAVQQTPSRQAAQMRALCRQQPRAIVVTAQDLGPQVFDELAAYQARGGIVVSYDVAVPLACDQVIFDREDNAYQGARHLIEHGHRALGLGLSQPPLGSANGPWHPQNQRLVGFRRALDEAGLPFRPEWILRHSTYEIGGAEMALHYLGLPHKPTALGIVNDYVALAFMAEVSRQGVRLPQDLSIIGHDDQPVAAYCSVPLTGISQPVERIAQAVVERLVARLRGLDEPPQTITIQGQLVQRQSVASV